MRLRPQRGHCVVSGLLSVSVGLRGALRCAAGSTLWRTPTRPWSSTAHAPTPVRLKLSSPEALHAFMMVVPAHQQVLTYWTCLGRVMPLKSVWGACSGNLPMGPWCYVDPTTCQNQPFVDSVGGSYDACAATNDTTTYDTGAWAVHRPASPAWLHMLFLCGLIQRSMESEVTVNPLCNMLHASHLFHAHAINVAEPPLITTWGSPAQPKL